MSKSKKVRKKKDPKIRVFIGESEAAALVFLKSFPDFREASPQNILKSCLKNVAYLRSKIMEEKRKNEEAKKRSDGDTAGELTGDDGVRGSDSGGEDNGGNQQDPRGQTEAEG